MDLFLQLALGLLALALALGVMLAIVGIGYHLTADRHAVEEQHAAWMSQTRERLGALDAQQEQIRTDAERLLRRPFPRSPRAGTGTAGATPATSSTRAGMPPVTAQIATPPRRYPPAPPPGTVTTPLPPLEGSAEQDTRPVDLSAAPTILRGRGGA